MVAAPYPVPGMAGRKCLRNPCCSAARRKYRSRRRRARTGDAHEQEKKHTGRTAASVACLAAPLARAQPTKQWRVAIVANNTSPAFEALLGNVRNELARLGYVEGQNIAYELRHVGGQLVAIKGRRVTAAPGRVRIPDAVLKRADRVIP
jgi:hypothetical protein